jgi:hypothetical protein
VSHSAEKQLTQATIETAALKTQVCTKRLQRCLPATLLQLAGQHADQMVERDSLLRRALVQLRRLAIALHPLQSG